MAIKTVYICSSCLESTPRWQGKCPNCGGWNTLEEDAVDTKRQRSRVTVKPSVVSTLVDKTICDRRLVTGVKEFDRVVGGGLVHDGLVLLTGDPGIGKSTLALQLALALARQRKRTLYVSGEESVSQISGRALRIDSAARDLTEFHLVSETVLESVIATIDQVKPDFVVADSVQTFSSLDIPGSAGTISQARMVAEKFMEVTKKKGIPTLLIGHVTKDGTLAGPKAMEHLVDAVLYFEGDRYQELRVLRAQKNRFGTTLEVGVFKMQGDGLMEVPNPSLDFLSGRKEGAVGSVISVTVEGSRPLLVEVQALTSSTDFNYPKRTASGMDTNRLQLLTAVLSKHARVKMDEHDVYTNVAGGFSVREPAMDLAVAAAILSSRLDLPLPDKTIVFGEVGLSGEVRNVVQEERRIAEAKKLGFTQVWGNLRVKADGAVSVRSVEDLKRLIEGGRQVHRSTRPLRVDQFDAKVTAPA